MIGPVKFQVKFQIKYLGEFPVKVCLTRFLTVDSNKQSFHAVKGLRHLSECSKGKAGFVSKVVWSVVKD